MHRAAAVLVAGISLTGVAVVPVATASPPAPVLNWVKCEPEPDPDPKTDAECAKLSVPLDWRRPDGPRFDLALARRTAIDKDNRIGSMVFGPGGPGDSGVQRIRTGIRRFGDQLRERFDIVSFDPRGVGASSPVMCSAELLARRPSPIIVGKAAYDATLRYNRELDQDCRTHSGPVYDHLDTLNTVHDLDAIRAALGEPKLTFHGSSYGTMLGGQYAEVFPHRIRAMVLESVNDHSLGTRAFLDTQTATVQDSFDEFVAWCNRAADCALRGSDVRGVWAGLFARAERGELPGLTPWTLSFEVQRRYLTGPDWPGLSRRLATLDTTSPSTASAAAPLGPNPFAILCQDWDLPVRSHQAYAAHLRRIARIAPDMRFPGALLAPAVCLGAPPASNPQHRLKVRHSPVILLTNSLHDPATGYNWATNVARQLGDSAVLLTYEGWGHGTYNSSPCAKAAIDRYLLTEVAPAPGTRCPAIA